MTRETQSLKDSGFSLPSAFRLVSEVEGVTLFLATDWKRLAFFASGGFVDFGGFDLVHFHAATGHSLFFRRRFGGGNFAVIADIHFAGGSRFDRFRFAGFSGLSRFRASLCEGRRDDNASDSGYKCESSKKFGH